MKSRILFLSTVFAAVSIVSAQSSHFSVFDKKKNPPAAGKVVDDPNSPTPEIHLAFDELNAGTTPNTGTSHIAIAVTGSGLVPGKIGKALDFSGEDCKITLGPVFSETISDIYTIALWVLSHDQQGYGMLFNSNGNFGVTLRLSGGGIDLNTGRTWHLMDAGANLIPREEWVHVAASSDGATARLYVNGKLIQEKSVEGGISMGATAEIGQGGLLEAENGSMKPTQLLNASIDDLRVYSKVLTDEQVANLAKSPK